MSEKRRAKMRIGSASDFFRGCQIACLVGIVALIGFGILFKIGLSRPQPEFTNAPLSLSDFISRFGDPGLPPHATNIFYGQSNVGFTGWLELYRFDAPVADCITYGKRLAQKNVPPESTELIPLESSPPPISRGPLDAMGLAEVDWFNVDTIQSGFEGHRMQPAWPRATFWIDTDRGRFYFYASD